MNRNICNEVSPPNDKRFESDDLMARSLTADETLQCQMAFVANAQELLSRLYAEGYRGEQSHERAPQMNVAKIIDAIRGREFSKGP
jgi:hypothetical protein